MVGWRDNTEFFVNHYPYSEVRKYLSGLQKLGHKGKGEHSPMILNYDFGLYKLRFEYISIALKVVLYFV